jgi:hypothetical protein
MLLRGLGRVLAYGDLSLAVEARGSIAGMSRRPSKSEPASIPMELSMHGNVRNPAIGCFDAERQQSALGMWNPEADISEKRKNNWIPIMVEPESAAGASRPRRRAWQHHSTDTRKSALALRRFRR